MLGLKFVRKQNGFYFFRKREGLIEFREPFHRRYQWDTESERERFYFGFWGFLKQPRGRVFRGCGGKSRAREAKSNWEQVRMQKLRTKGVIVVEYRVFRLGMES